MSLFSFPNYCEEDSSIRICFTSPDYKSSCWFVTFKKIVQQCMPEKTQFAQIGALFFHYNNFAVHTDIFVILIKMTWIQSTHILLTEPSSLLTIILSLLYILFLVISVFRAFDLDHGLQTPSFKMAEHTYVCRGFHM